MAVLTFTITAQENITLMTLIEFRLYLKKTLIVHRLFFDTVDNVSSNKCAKMIS